MKKIFIAAIISCFALKGNAQQNPHYTQYMYNMSVINPAYAGSKENLTGGVLYRKQWVDLEGAPTTGTFFIHSPVGKKVGLGLSVVTDRLGPVSENNVYGDFSYTLDLGGEHHLAFGLKAGVTMHKAGLRDEVYNNVPDLNDDAFGQNSNRTLLNFGSGLFYYTNKYYVAFSIPNMKSSYYLDYNGKQFGSSVQHYFLTGGYVFDLNEKVKFKPFAMIKTAFGTPASIDLSTNFMFNNVFELGATFRRQDSYGLMVNYAISPGLRIGYAYDQIYSDLKISTPSSHEVILLFDLNFPKKVSQSPRYF
ncbi:MAG: hypothetical protein CFE24_05535 [Flavobacterium sp. BFFFF2]|nr:MAG: hypothetical protein CFE24_05535 [Flavobacterium sp. BFFFF2]